jgi:hypothetical protein
MSPTARSTRVLPLVATASLLLAIAGANAVFAHTAGVPTPPAPLVGAVVDAGARVDAWSGTVRIDVPRARSVARGTLAAADGRRLGSVGHAEALVARADAGRPDAWIERADTDTPTPKARTESASSDAGADIASFSGRNRVWIPALGIRRSTAFFSCSSTAYPADRVYRWGCAGRNNIYLFGHAHSVFRPLHDAYVRGTLRKGMVVLYADGAGRVSRYKVVWWKVTTPDKGEFAYAAQSRPSMTLQTCVGSKSQFRLIVRLNRVG